MGWLGRLFGRRRGREYVVRADFETRPMEEWTDDEYDHWMNTTTEENYWGEWERWSHETVPHATIKHVRQQVIDLAREAAKASMPQEFGCFLRVVKSTVTELVLTPGTIQGDRHAIFQFSALPVDRTIRGTLHSHPSPHPYPSDADFALFEKHGQVHIIFGSPFGPDDWRAYDHTGQPISLMVVP